MEDKSLPYGCFHPGCKKRATRIAESTDALYPLCDEHIKPVLESIKDRDEAIKKISVKWGKKNENK